MSHHYKPSGSDTRNVDKQKQRFLEQRKRSSRQTVFTTIASFGTTLAIVLGFILISTMAHANATQTASGSPVVTPTSPGYGTLNHPKGPCGNPGQAACPAIDPGWFSISSAAPSAIASAIEQSSTYRSMQAQHGYTSIDTPAWVHTMVTHPTGISYYDNDHWIVSARNASGQRCGIFDFVYDKVNHRMRFSSYGVITPTDPHAKIAFPYTSPVTASALLQKQRGLTMLANSPAELVFFPINPSYRDLNSPVHLWSGGGDSPMDPIWHLKGANGQNYYVGQDQHVYLQTDLPITTGKP